MATLKRITTSGIEANTSKPILHHINESSKTGTSQTQEQILLDRLKQVVTQCSLMNTSRTGLALEITGNEKMKFAYCVVPKAGCTMWQRVLQHIAGQRGAAADLMSLSKYQIHYKGFRFKREFTMKNNKPFIEDSLRSMTVRDPYTRLWSAYIDKLIMPDFWITKGKMIVRMIRHNPNTDSLKCGHDVTFAEFIEYVIRTGHDRKYISQDKHWLPASDICDPCTFKPEVIGKQESFMADFKYTVDRLKRPDILEKMLVKDVDEYEIEDEVDYNFNIDRNRCATKELICARMWTAFQYNGYIPPSEKFENYVDKGILNKLNFLSVIRSVRDKFNVTRSDKKRWRKEAIKTAFSSLSKDQLYKLGNLYKQDFELFGYKNYPDFL